MKFNILTNYILDSHKLPLTVIHLDDWSCVTVEGKNSKKYLQGQLTIDIDLLKIYEHIICAHCNINGKVWSIMRLLHYNNGYMYIQRNDISNVQIKELKKYAIFSNITITNNNDLLLLGIFGLNSKSMLLNFFSRIPDENHNVVHNNDITILWIKDPIERFLLIIPRKNQFLKKIKKSNVHFKTSNQWISLDIESGYPIITSKMINKFLPLSINLEGLGGINFNKGCYYGQEVIAKIKFKSINKRCLYWIKSNKSSNKAPEIGDLVECQKNNDWYVVGQVLISVVMYNNIVSVQAVLDSNLDMNSILRINNDFYNNLFYIKKRFGTILKN